jgi:hypothetical protein
MTDIIVFTAVVASVVLVRTVVDAFLDVHARHRATAREHRTPREMTPLGPQGLP